MNQTIAAIGEVMVELSPGSASGYYQQGFAGDTFNTAVGLARLGANTHYVTLLGDDHFSDGIVALMRLEGVGADTVQRLPGRQPGLYIINNDANGERSFRYWRSEAPARELWGDRHDLASIEAQLLDCSHLYLSGITLAIMQPLAREQLYQFLVRYRQRDGIVAFDSNYRPSLWANQVTAQQVIGRFLGLSDIALLTLADEQLLWAEVSPEVILRRHQSQGVKELVIKQGGLPVLLNKAGNTQCIEVPSVTGVTDTTGAGDAFNAGYLAARLQNRSPEEAVTQANCAAAVVIQYRGGLIARERFLSAMPVFWP